MSRKEDILEWVDDLSMGETSLDSHTKEFIRNSNEFIDAKNIGRADEKIDAFLDYLTAYAQKHFAAQEGLMEKIDYPSLTEHIESHKVFVRSIAKLYKKRLLLRRNSSQVPSDEYDDRGIDGVITDTADLIRDWYYSHLLGVDKTLYDYYKYEHED